MACCFVVASTHEARAVLDARARSSWRYKEKAMTLRTVDVPGDGDCFYYSFLVGVNYLKESRLRTARGSATQEARRAARNLRAVLLHALPEDPAEALRQYGFEAARCEEVRRRLLSKDEFAESEELQIAATAFARRLCIRATVEGKKVWDTITPNASRRTDAEGCDPSERGTVFLKLEGEHYDALLPKARQGDDEDADRFRKTFEKRLQTARAAAAKAVIKVSESPERSLPDRSQLPRRTDKHVVEESESPERSLLDRSRSPRRRAEKLVIEDSESPERSVPNRSRRRRADKAVVHVSRSANDRRAARFDDGSLYAPRRISESPKDRSRSPRRAAQVKQNV